MGFSQHCTSSSDPLQPTLSKPWTWSAGWYSRNCAEGLSVRRASIFWLFHYRWKSEQHSALHAALETPLFYLNLYQDYPMVFSSAFVLWHVRQLRCRGKAKLNCFFVLFSAIRTLGSHSWSLKFNFFISKLEWALVLPRQRDFCSLADKEATDSN